ncbi:hypothetical protein [Actinoplanes sp. NPDC051411]|uniref:hypothetical protein n=1 Tax=Actinoplanes sp. NPDC051411 TaxID=3155522 RepID=UPI0034220612
MPGPQPVFPPPMMSSGLPSYTVPPAAAKSPAGHQFGANSPSADNPSATQPFAAGSPASATQPFSPGSPAGSAQTGTPPVWPGSQPPTTSPSGAGPATQPAQPSFGSGSPAPATQPFASQPYGTGSPSASPEDAPHPYRDSAGHPYGVGGAAATRKPFGGYSSPSAQRTAPSDTYGSSVPQQRNDLGSDGYPSPDATMPVPTGFPPADMTMPVYNYGSIDSTMPVSTNPVENSGSLTGHILAQGWHDEATDRRRSNVKVAVAMLVVLGLLVTVSLVFLLTAGDAFTNMVRGVFK